MRVVAILLCFAGFGLATAVPPASAATQLLPDLKTLPPRDLRFDRADVSANGSGAMHNVLRFTNTVWNVGAGRLELRATINPATRDGAAFQRIVDDSGGRSDTEVGRFYWHAVHSHYHYDDWGRYQLWTKAAYDAWVASGRTQGAPEDIGTKTTSCVMDEEFIKTLPNMPYPGRFPSDGCFPDSDNFMIQGLSPGWGDTYDYWRFEQWIDLDQAKLADGAYVLRSVTDPLNKIIESPNKADDSRESAVANEGVTEFTVSGGKIVDGAKPTGTVRINDVATGTSSAAVTVKVLGRDDVSGVDQVRLSNDGAHWTSPRGYTGSGSSSMAVSWDLNDPAYGGTAGNGTKVVHVQFHDRSGKWSSDVVDDIVLNPGARPPVSDPGGGVLPPNDLVATALSSSRIDLHWTDNSNNETAMVVQRDTGSQFNSPVVTSLPANTTAHAVTGLQPQTTYYFRVRAEKDATTRSSWSGVNVVTTLAAPSQVAPQPGQGAGEGETPEPSPAAGIRASITRVVNGDTIVTRPLARSSRRRYTVRLLGIDAPEPGECGSARAANRLRALVARGRKVLLSTDASRRRFDRHGRLLAYARTSTGRELNLSQLRAGWARLWVPGRRFAQYRSFKRAARMAKHRQRGAWGACGGMHVHAR